MRRWGNELDHVVSVRFDRAALGAVKQLSEGSGMTVSSWIRKLIDREIAAPESTDFTLDDGTVVQLPADAMRAIAGKLTPLMFERGAVSLTFGAPWREDEKRRREDALATTHEVLGGRPLDLVPGSGRLGVPRAVPSSLGTRCGTGRTFSCQHMSIGNVVSAECWICGPLMAVA